MATKPDPKTGLYKPAGPQQPSKYPFTGAQYGIYGEQQGYIYDPYTDSYKIDRKAAGDYYENSGLVEPAPKEPGLGEVLLPIAGAGAALAGGKYVGEQAGEWLGLGKEASAEGAGLLGSGGSAAVQGAGAAPTAINSAANGGTLMSNGAVAAPGFFETGGLLGEGPMTAGQYVPGVLGAVGAYDLLANKRHGGRGALQGAASGAGIGFTLGGPVGAGIGAGIGALTGYFGNFGDVDAYKTEWKRKKRLLDLGIITEAQLGPEPRKGRSKEELIAEAKATGGNVTFAGSRNESDLTPVDIVGYASVIEEAHKRGVDPMALATQAIQNKAVREHHGTVDLDLEKLDKGAPAAQPVPLAPASQPVAPAVPSPGRIPNSSGYKRMDNGLLSVRS